MIGVFDSGLGGTLLLNTIMKDKDIDVLYIGDRHNHPYGTKSDAEIIKIFDAHMQMFKDANIHEVVIACNTLCSTIPFDNYPDLKLHDIIQKTIDQVNIDKDASILVVGTPKTIEKGRYVSLLNKKGYFNIEAKALEKLAVYVEKFESDDVVLAYLKNELQGLKPDLIILACTHYPVYKHLFKNLFHCDIIDSTKLEFNFDDESGHSTLKIRMDENEELNQFLAKYLEYPYTYDKDCTSF